MNRFTLLLAFTSVSCLGMTAPDREPTSATRKPARQQSSIGEASAVPQPPDLGWWCALVAGKEKRPRHAYCYRAPGKCEQERAALKSPAPCEHQPLAFCFWAIQPDGQKDALACFDAPNRCVMERAAHIERGSVQAYRVGPCIKIR